MKRSILISLSIISLTTSFAQVQKDSTLQKRNFQVSFISPLGTNGHQSLKTENKISLNILGGAAGGLNGLEIGSLANIETQYAHGVQISGFVNAVRGEVNGAQIAGFANLSAATSGIQVAGFTNVATDSVVGFQISGFNNTSAGSHKGGQIAGFNNNTRSMSGIQVAGFSNISLGNTSGAQVAGFMNFSKSDLKGSQIAGFLNIAKKVSGIQIGVINVCDSLDGITIGVFNFVKHGYRSLEFGGNETFQTTLSFKSGSQRFYNIYSGGIQWTASKPAYAVGYGVGTRMNLGKKIALDIDAISYWVVRKNNSGYQSINKLQPTFSYNLINKFSVFAGPTFNVIVEDKNFNNVDVSPWKMYDYKTSRNDRIIMYPGFRVGIKF